MRLYDADIVSAYRHDRTAEGPRRAVYTFAYNSLIRVGFGLRVRDVNFAFKLVRQPRPRRRRRAQVRRAASSTPSS